MSDLISRQDAIDAIHEDADWLAAQGSDWQVERMERDKSILMSLPSAQPRKKGKWVDKKDSISRLVWGECSICGYDSAIHYCFCPNCGCQMNGGEESE